MVQPAAAQARVDALAAGAIFRLIMDSGLHGCVLSASGQQ
jgi:hypothetical protein